MATLFERTVNLKMRRASASVKNIAISNPQDMDDVEFSASSSSFESDDKKDDDFMSSTTVGSVGISIFNSSRVLQELSPFSRRIARFVSVAPSNHAIQQFDRQTSSFLLRISIAAVLRSLPGLFIVFSVPFLMWDAYPNDWSLLCPWPLIQHVGLVWSSLLHISVWPVTLVTLMTVAFFPRAGIHVSNKSESVEVLSKTTSVTDRVRSSWRAIAANVSQSQWKMSLVLALLLLYMGIFQMVLQMGYPSVVWNPFIWGWYRVYLPSEVYPSLSRACLNFQKDSANPVPLCLSERQWKELSSGALSSYNPDDVVTVQRGLNYLQNESGGIVINALARNVANNIPALKQNMDGLVPFFNGNSRDKLSLVVFENDSDDGTRALFQQWSEEESSSLSPRYNIDLIHCGAQNPECKLGIMDRYDNMNLFTNPTASGVGKLGEFRQVALEYIMNKKEYNDFSHMIVLDVDLGVSLSPLGLLHTLGLESSIAQTHVVASASSQVWPGSMGSIIPPYDLSAFRPEPTSSNRRVRNLHTSFCEIMPKGDRWRNMCEACSPMQLFLIQSANDVTNHHGKAYTVSSAFNGLTMYPFSLIREKGPLARYDSGDDNQRCEHVGFNLSLRELMYVNPKWKMHLKPHKPGGPTGFRALKTLMYAFIGRPNVMTAMMLGNLVFFYLFVVSLWMIGSSVKSFALSMSEKSNWLIDKREEKNINGLWIEH